MTKKSNHHVVPHKDGWAVRRENSDRVSGLYPTQGDAIRGGRGISKNQGTELVIHRPNGQIREKDSHGNDPSPPKG
ncbi:DUF2188 domain-containing protein [Pseudoduganella chitinolytica]|uniref:DUF2188 domain-containing protein n=1 Tax=Pseudoduganella chitinolytica TaxID=34070 RepID=A0ABY8B663_9BURK|nr:DUF2188 domain-containing protein [Pseudoduganella chitinolytica]WEF31226.1 DUF2188 domain-containing protein [Pseudoduganella chitinolytica]